MMNHTPTLVQKNIARASDAQRLASHPEISAWVNASAGSGKTKVLVDRFIRLMLKGVPAQKILCLTYTRAGTAQMYTRLLSRLKIFASAPEDTLTRLLKDLDPEEKITDHLLTLARNLFLQVLDAPGGLKIMTLHGFCQHVLKRFPLEAGLTPAFNVLEELEANNLWAQAVKSVYSTPELQDALAILSASYEEITVLDLIQKMATKRRGHTPSHPGDILREKLGMKNLSFETLEADFKAGIRLDQLRQTLTVWLNIHPQAKKALKISHVIEGVSNPNAVCVDTYIESFFKSTNDAPYANYLSAAAQKLYPEHETFIKDEADRCYRYLLQKNALEYIELNEALYHAADAAREMYTRLKAERAVLDYDDLIDSTTRILNQKEATAWVLYKLEGGIDHILVDEAQDTNSKQWDILRALSQDFFSGQGRKIPTPVHPTLFVVGDTKQSIFGFQGADPKALSREEHVYKTLHQNVKRDLKIVPFDVSFRCAPGITAAVNAVLEQPEVQSGVGFSPPHLPAREGQGGHVEIWAPPQHQKSQDSEAWKLPLPQDLSRSSVYQCAENIARQIKLWLESEEFIPSRRRKIQASDILILSRARDPLQPIVMAALQKHGIPVAGSDQLDLKQDVGVMDMMNILSFLSLPEDDFTLACVLKSPLCGLTEEELYTLSVARGDRTLWQQIQNNRDYPWAEMLRNLLSQADWQAPSQILGRIYYQYDGLKKCRARLGDECITPLEALLELALSFESLHPPSLQGFLRWIKETHLKLKRESETEGGTGVRLMTLHGAKGLEAPIVFLLDKATLPSVEDEFIPLPETDFLIKNPVKKLTEFYEPLHSALNIREEALRSEYMRLLYVGLTRAEDKLIITGWLDGKNTKIDPGCWYDVCERALKPLSQMQENRLVLHLPLTAQIDRQERAKDALPQASLPDWIFKAPEENFSAFKRTLTKATATIPLAAHSPALRYGNLFHDVMARLTATNYLNWPKVCEDLLNTASPEDWVRLEQEMQKIIKNQSLAALVFHPLTRAEVPITAEDDAILFTGSIDRLIVEASRVTILDFKTNQIIPAPDSDLYLSYRNQIRAYTNVMARLYPDRELRAFVVWTTTATYDEIVLEDEARPVKVAQKR